MKMLNDVLKRVSGLPVLAVAVTALVATGAPAMAGGKKPVVVEPWVREAPPAMKMHAAYLVLMNPTDAEVSLVGASSPQYEMAELHLSKVEGGIATMAKQDQITVAPKGELHMEPGSFHVMLMYPKQPVKAGDTVNITLTLADGSTIAVDAPVKKAHGMQKGMDRGKRKMN